MSADFLTTLAARTLGLTPVIQPAIASIFAPQSLLEQGRWQMVTERSKNPQGSEAEGRREESFDMQTISSPSSSSSPSASLVSSGNSSQAISRLPYSQILPAVPHSDLSVEEPENRPLSSLNNSDLVTENISNSPVQPLYETTVNPNKLLANQVNLEQKSDTPIENTIDLEINNHRQHNNSEIITSQKINTVTPESLAPVSPQLQAEQNAQQSGDSQIVTKVDDREKPIQLNVNSERLQANEQPSLTAPKLPIEHPQAMSGDKSLGVQTPLAEPLYSDVNIETKISNQNTRDNAASAFDANKEQSNVIPSLATENIVQRQVEAATSLPLERSESLTPRVEPLINQVNLQPQTPDQQHFDSQQQEFPNSNEPEIFTSGMEVLQSESRLSLPSIVSVNAVTPVVSALENQQTFVSPRQADSATSANPTGLQSPVSPPSIVAANAVTPVVSPLENQQTFVSPRQADSATPANPTNSHSPVSPPSILAANAVTPVVSPLENQQTFVSLHQADSATPANPTDSHSPVSPPSIVAANAVTPVVSPLENQQTFVSPHQADSATPANPTNSHSPVSPPSILAANAVTPVVSPLENQQTFVSPHQADSATPTNPTDSHSPLSPPSILAANAVTPVVSPLENQQTFVSPRQADSEKVAPAVAVSEFQIVTHTVSNTISPSQSQIPAQISLMSAAVPVPDTLEQQSLANFRFSGDSQRNQAVPTPTEVTALVDRRIVKSDNSGKNWEFQARLPLRNSSHENTAKVKPLVVVSQQRSPDLENETQLNNKQETSLVLPPTVQVTIGRIEVRSSPTPTAPKANNKSTPRQPSVSLQDYLKQRQGGKP